MEFLDEQDPKMAQEVRSNYVEVLGRIYTGLFRKYITDLQLLIKKDHIPDNRDLIGCELQKLSSGIFGSFGTKKTEAYIIDVLSIGKRAKVFKDMEDETYYHLALKKGEKLYFEEIFAAISKSILTTASSEFSFINDFFGTTQMYSDIFGKTFSFFFEQLEDFLFGTYDVICVMFLLCIVRRHQETMKTKQLQCLDRLWAKSHDLLLPKFKTLMDAHIDSVHKLYVTGAQIQDSNIINVYFVARRYAEVSVALTILHQDYTFQPEEGKAESFKDEIGPCLAHLRQEMEALFVRTSNYIELQKDQVVYLINLYDIISRVYLSRNVISEDLTLLQNIQQQQIEMYVDDELQTSSAFARMISLVKSMQELIDGPNDAKIRMDEGRLGAIVRDFKEGWQEGIDQLNEQITYNFSEKWKKIPRNSEAKDKEDNPLNHLEVAWNIPPSQNGEDSAGSNVEIMRMMLTQLVTYYQNFQAILSKLEVSPAISRDLVSRQTILYEIKKYHKTEKGLK
eukprot:TRINITY_DN2912_c0_g1_i1.p1 TRINITY_DN2912_c0_g1~~TRINITY_DN2912_c0_g1_i1.p1  ORF type:complete len:508 (-),score=161.50 TRINITY_DN2912_c0_g1_i1:554-2077(-)